MDKDDREALYEDIRMLAERDGIAEVMAAIARYANEATERLFRQHNTLVAERHAKAFESISKAAHEALRQGV